ALDVRLEPAGTDVVGVADEAADDRALAADFAVFGHIGIQKTGSGCSRGPAWPDGTSQYSRGSGLPRLSAWPCRRAVPAGPRTRRQGPASNYLPRRTDGGRPGVPSGCRSVATGRQVWAGRVGRSSR